MLSNNIAITKIFATVTIVIILITTISGVILYYDNISHEPQNTPIPQPTETPIPTPTPTPTPTPASTPLPNIPSEKTQPKNQGTVKIGSHTFTFDSTQVETIRPDIFNPGYFSVFDILVHLHKEDVLNLQYHFDQSMNTHVIDEINGETDWWYQIYYSGGWPERNVFRPDHYPWKDQTTLTFYKETSSRINSIYTVWKEEIVRKNSNNQEVIIPQVEISSKSFTLTFENVRVTPHNLRNDVLKDGTITAIDTILSLADQGKISYELQYYESIGTAGIVKSYWVEAINQDFASGRAGYVYEAGSTQFRFSSGNHIHLPSDTRVLNSPEYVEYFWISL